MVFLVRRRAPAAAFELHAYIMDETSAFCPVILLISVGKTLIVEGIDLIK
jgi:hypothetical protein